MVAHQRHDMAPLLKSNHLLDHIPAFGPAINVVPLEDKHVLGMRFHVLKKRSQGSGTFSAGWHFQSVSGSGR